MRRCPSLSSTSLLRQTRNFLICSNRRLSLIPSSHIPSTPLPSLPSIAQAPLDLLSLLLANQLAYGKDERDMVVLHHELGTITPGGERELMSSSMIQFGVVGGDSAMATTVGMVCPSPHPTSSRSLTRYDTIANRPRSATHPGWEDYRTRNCLACECRGLATASWGFGEAWSENDGGGSERERRGAEDVEKG